MKIIISPLARTQVLSIAQRSVEAFAQVARSYTLLEHIAYQSSADPDYWTRFKESDIRIRSSSTLKGNIPIWELYSDYNPHDAQCIALLIELDEQLQVLGFCSQNKLRATIIQLIDTWLPC
jgi:hypothetical protein